MTPLWVRRMVVATTTADRLATHGPLRPVWRLLGYAEQWAWPTCPPPR